MWTSVAKLRAPREEAPDVGGARTAPDSPKRRSIYAPKLRSLKNIMHRATTMHVVVTQADDYDADAYYSVVKPCVPVLRHERAVPSPFLTRARPACVLAGNAEWLPRMDRPVFYPASVSVEVRAPPVRMALIYACSGRARRDLTQQEVLVTADVKISVASPVPGGVFGSAAGPCRAPPACSPATFQLEDTPAVTARDVPRRRAMPLFGLQNTRFLTWDVPSTYSRYIQVLPAVEESWAMASALKHDAQIEENQNARIRRHLRSDFRRTIHRDPPPSRALLRHLYVLPPAPHTAASAGGNGKVKLEAESRAQPIAL
ncbi:hypothetical protein BD310DRAFT_910496 [Dichomitus squalens]|uniref:Uncharacterized protein n=1 Tax=Dichomitus squalens TaxID=114155 RepID=A0A4Q9PGP0_9APHY|nr:hypothetical protein BD310DRAFT_910496 [Dichomitus squalens]